jgi:hypothetical protein
VAYRRCRHVPMSHRCHGCETGLRLLGALRRPATSRSGRQIDGVGIVRGHQQSSTV